MENTNKTSLNKTQMKCEKIMGGCYTTIRISAIIAVGAYLVGLTAGLIYDRQSKKN